MKWLLIILIEVPHVPTYEIQVGTFDSIAVCQEVADTRTVLETRVKPGWVNKQVTRDITSTYALRAYCRPK